MLGGDAAPALEITPVGAQAVVSTPGQRQRRTAVRLRRTRLARRRGTTATYLPTSEPLPRAGERATSRRCKQGSGLNPPDCEKRPRSLARCPGEPTGGFPICADTGVEMGGIAEPGTTMVRDASKGRYVVRMR